MEQSYKIIKNLIFFWIKENWTLFGIKFRIFSAQIIKSTGKIWCTDSISIKNKKNQFLEEPKNKYKKTQCKIYKFLINH